MAIKINFLSDVSQITRDMSSLGDRLESAADDLEHMEQAGRDAADGIDAVADAGRDLDRTADATDDTARSLDDVADAGNDAARQLEDVSATGRDLDRVADAGDDAARSLEDVADAGKGAGKGLQEVEDDAEKMARGVEGEVDDMERKTRDAFRNMARHARDSTDGIAKTSRRDFNRAGDATETFKDEAQQNLSETLSSFDGSIEGMVDGLQGTLGGVVGDLGPGGVIGAGAIAAGIGVGMAYAEKVAEGINEQGDIVAALAEELADVGGSLDDIDLQGRMEEWGLAIQDNRKNWELWQETAETGLEHVADLAERAGTDFEDSFRGVTGSLEDSEKMLAEVEQRLADLEGSEWTQSEAAERKIEAERRALEELKGELEQNIETQQRAAEVEEMRADVIGVTNEALAEQVERQEELTGVLTTAEEAELDYLDALDKTTQTIAENGKTLDKNTEKGRENRRALIDLRDSIFEYAEAELTAGASTESVTADLGEQRTAFIRAAESAGYTTSEAERLADAYGLIPDQIVTDVDAKGVDATKRELDSIDRSIYSTVYVRESGVNSAKNRIRWAFSSMRVNVRVHPTIPTASAW